MKKLAATFTVLACMASAAAFATEAAPQAKPAFGEWGMDLSSMDKGVKPGDDFFLYVNGAWLKTARIPPDRTSTGSFQDLQILSEKRMRDIVAGLEARPYAQLSAGEKQLRDLYDAFEDAAAIEAAGLKPFQNDLDYLASLKTADDVAAAMAGPGRPADSLFLNRVTPDPKNPNAYVVTITQSGLGLPDRDYYLRDDKDLAATRDAYKKYMAATLTLLGARNADTRAQAVFDLETAIAKSHWPAADRRDANKAYNPMTVAELAAYAPGFPWATYFKAEGVPPDDASGKPREIIVRENTAFPGLAKTFSGTPVAVWRDWLTLHYAHNMAPFMPKRFDDTDFGFFGKVLGGQQQQLDRPTRGVRLLDQRLGHPLGKLYVARYFPPAAKAKAEELVANLLKAYDADIRSIDWMTDVTKQKALEKLHAFTPHIGYPAQWRDYSGLSIARNDLAGDVERSNVFEWDYRLNRIDQPVDRNEWNMTPPTINAYYTSVFNSIFFPAAILQPPFFDPNADDAVNYGGIGAVIGHEISHGFDDQGSKYNGAGVLTSWWTDEDRKNFEARTSALGAQYDTYSPLPGMNVNGKLTMGENIGDLSGLSISLKAYHISLNGQAAPVIDGLTGDQRFFLSYGQIWRAKYRDGAMRQQVLSNPHSPPQFRVDGATRNIDAWYDAFNIQPTDKYYLPPDKRVRLW